MKALYWGRFNPPHKGHMQVVKSILKEADELIIAVGNSQEKNTKRSPFDGNERKKMWKNFLREEGLDTKNIKLVSIPDADSFSESVDNLFEYCDNFDVIYTDRETIIKLIKNRVKIKRIKRSGTISSTKIRESIAKDKKWEHLTGKSVVRLIKKFDGIKRIKRVY